MGEQGVRHYGGELITQGLECGEPCASGVGFAAWEGDGELADIGPGSAGEEERRAGEGGAGDGMIEIVGPGVVEEVEGEKLGGWSLWGRCAGEEAEEFAGFGGVEKLGGGDAAQARLGGEGDVGEEVVFKGEIDRAGVVEDAEAGEVLEVMAGEDFGGAGGDEVLIDDAVLGEVADPEGKVGMGGVACGFGHGAAGFPGGVSQTINQQDGLTGLSELAACGDACVACTEDDDIEDLLKDRGEAWLGGHAETFV